MIVPDISKSTTKSRRVQELVGGLMDLVEPLAEDRDTPLASLKVGPSSFRPGQVRYAGLYGGSRNDFAHNMHRLCLELRLLIHLNPVMYPPPCKQVLLSDESFSEPQGVYDSDRFQFGRFVLTMGLEGWCRPCWLWAPVTPNYVECAPPVSST